VKAKPVYEENVSPKVEVPVPAEAKTYFVITGSFKSKENADSQINMLKEEGFTPEIVAADNGFYRVCAMICNDLNTAVTKKDTIVKKFPGTWISRKK
jgi:cell division protein FtsN